MKCIAVPGDMSIIDVVIEVDGRQVTQINREPVEEVAARRPGAVVVDIDAFIAERDAKLVSEPEPITEEQWWDALEALPPIRWRTVLGVELFQFAERHSGCITGTYARIGARYLHWYDRDTETHDALAHKAGAALAKLEATA